MKYFFPLKYFCQKIWYGHVECISDKLARKNSRIGQKVFAHCPRTVQREFQENFLSKRSFGLRRKNQTLTETIGQQAGNFPLNVRKRFLNECFSKKISPSNFSFGVVGEGSVEYPGEIFLPSSRYILAHCPKKKEIILFFRKTITANCPIGQVKCSFENGSGKILSDDRKSYVKVRQTRKLYAFQANFFFVIDPTANRM